MGKNCIKLLEMLLKVKIIIRKNKVEKSFCIIFDRYLKFIPLFIFPIDYIFNHFVIKITHIKLISAINLDLFSFLLSLVTTTVVLLLTYYNKIWIRVNIHKNRIILFLIFASILTFLYIIGIFLYNNDIAIEKWDKISLFRIAVSLISFLTALYAPAYILDRILLRTKWTVADKIVFYPVVSALILSLLEYLNLLFETSIPYRALTVILIGTTILLLYVSCHHARYSFHIDVDLVEALGLSIVIGFRLFIFYSVLGEENIFLRGDMFGDTHRVAFLMKYGLKAYLLSPVGDYPIFHSLLWSTLSKVSVIPYINTLILIAFFNQVFSILALYILAKFLFRDSRSALLTVILWTILSGFSWTLVKLDAPAKALSGSELLDYIEIISRRLGKYSGSIVSPTYMDGNALTRLWSLGLFFNLDWSVGEGVFR